MDYDTSITDDRVIDLDGIQLHVVERGTNLTSTVVMVHGLNTQLHTWDEVAHALSHKMRVITLDLRGHGDSSWSRDGYWTSDFVNDLVTLFEKLSLQGVAYVGHSMGARIGVALAARYPQLVARLILSDGAPEMASAAAREVQGRQSGPTGKGRPMGFRDMDEVRKHFQDQNPTWNQGMVDYFARYQVRKNWAGKYVLKADPDLFWLTGSAGQRDAGELWSETTRVKCPTLLAWASRGVLDESIVERMEANITEIEVLKFDCGHGIPRECSGSFITAVSDFLDRNGGTGARTVVNEP